MVKGYTSVIGMGYVNYVGVDRPRRWPNMMDPGSGPHS